MTEPPHPPADPPEEFRDLVEQSLSGVFILTAERFAYANRTFQELVGYSLAELGCQGPWDIVHPEERERVQRLSRERIARARPSEVYETRLVHRDGHEVWVEVRAAPFTFRGEPSALVHMVDITERKRAEQALATSEARLRDFFEHAPIGIYRMTRAGRLTQANDALQAMLGYGPGRPWPAAGLDREAFDPAFPQSELRRRLEHDGQARGVESAWIRRDDSLLYVREGARLVRDPAGGVLYVEGTAEDVTVQKQAAQRLQYYSQRMQARHEIDQAMLQARSADDLAAAVVTRLQRLVPCQRASVLLYDRERRAARVAATSYEPGFSAGPAVGTWIPYASLTPTEDVRELPFLYLTDLAQARSLSPLLQDLLAQGVRSVLSLPLRAGETLLGQLNLASGRASAFGSEHKQLALELSQQLATALERERLRSALQAEGERLLALLENLPAGIIWLDGRGRKAVSNRLAEELLAAPGAPRVEQLAELCADGEAPAELQVGGPSLRLFELVSRPVPPPGAQAGLLLLLREVTAERLLQRQVRQQERLAAIGELARGVAHDFNNLLTAIQGLLQLARRRRPDPALEEIAEVCERGGGLTRQLLAFGRRQDMQARPLDLNQAVEGLTQLLRRLLGADVELALTPSPGPVWVHADPAQVEQVLLNLVVNARDAMPRGGRLDVVVESVDIAPDDSIHRTGAVPPGRYARLTVADTGQGMDEATQARAFEPFFTTKAERGGTGLGLATVYGIVRQSGGEIRLISAPGQGARFEILLPRLEDRFDLTAVVKSP